ncbi:MAG: formate/nitrite transporter family protein [Candidatus Tectomicrobia bacterium]|nr:formate/nitrite transporter family protein [Candidatus Tectomicrobia bacterium]
MIEIDAYSPQEIARKVETLGVTKARCDTLTVLVLAVLAGAFISLGAIFFMVVVTDSALGFGVNRLLGGVAFSLGLILVVVGGAELFTGNNLIAMAWASRKVSTGEVLRNWVLVYFGNVVGALGTVALVGIGGVHRFGGGAVGQTVLAIGRQKASLGFWEALALGVLCNTLVCLSVWLAMGGRGVTDKILAIVFPISAFVTVGFEHSIANMFFLPYAIALDGFGGSSLWLGSVRNLAAVTAGNVIGGTLLVAGVYWMAYLRGGLPGGDAEPPEGLADGG